MTRLRFRDRLFRWRLTVAAVAAAIAWYLGRHAFWWLTLALVPRLSAAPKHWFAHNPESLITGIEWRVGLVCALVTFAIFFRWPPTVQTAIGVTRFFYGGMYHAKRRFLGVVIPTAIAAYVVRGVFWFIGLISFGPTRFIATVDPVPLVTHYAVIAAWVAFFLFGPNFLLGNVLKYWSESVAARESISPTFLRLASGISSGPDISRFLGCGPTLLIAVLGAPFFALWLIWQTAMVVGSLIGFRSLLGWFLESRRATVYDIGTRAPLQPGLGRR